MVAEDPLGGIILGLIFVIFGFIFRFKPAMVFKLGFIRHWLKMMHIIIPGKRIIIIFKFIGLAFLLMGIVALLIILR